jgi:hypothetical protein
MKINNQIKIHIFLISSGRTGTEFFGKRLKDLSQYIYSVHEPDRLSIKKHKRKELFLKLKKLGVYNVLIMRMLGKTGTRALSLKRLNNKIDKENTIERIISDRKLLHHSYSQVYIESNWQLFGLLDTLNELRNSKIIFLFRDPRNWVMSWMNREKGWYSESDLLLRINLLGFKRITPKNVGIYNPDWKNYDRFQKLCWVWNYLNSTFYNAIDDSNPNIQYFFFEDIFTKKDPTTIKNFLKFTLNDYFNEEYVNQMLKTLNKKVNQSTTKRFPQWPNWDRKQCKDLHYFCGELMQKLGYGNEPEWLEKIN